MHVTWGWVDPATRWVAGTKLPAGQPSRHQDGLQNEWLVNQCMLQVNKRAAATVGYNMNMDWTSRLPRLRVAARIASAPEGSPPLTVELRWIGTVTDDDGSLRTDPLLADEFVHLNQWQPQLLGVTTHVPKQASPGEYVIELTVYCQEGWGNEQKVSSIQLTVRVHPVALPDPEHFAFHLDLWQHPTRWAQYYRVPRWSDAHFEIIDAMAAKLAAVGQKAVTVIAADAPWAGQGCRHDIDYPMHFYEYNMVDVTREADGTISCNFSVMDRYIDTFFRHGISREIEVYGLLGAWHDDFGTPLTDYPDPIRIRCYDTATKTYGFLTTRAELAAYVARLMNHFRQRGLLNVVRIASDEPADTERFTECLQFLRSIDSDMKFKIACNHAEFMADFQNDVLDWVPYITLLSRDVAVTESLAAGVRERGGTMSWYVCCSPEYPNTWLKSPLTETRLIGWLTDWFELDGFLRWAAAAWPEDVWQRPGWRWRAGEMFLVYPGTHGKPVSSLRWEMLRAGIQDFELLRLTRATIANVTDPEDRERFQKRLRAIMQRIVSVGSLAEFQIKEKTPPELYTQRYDDFAAARRDVLQLLADVQA